MFRALACCVALVAAGAQAFYTGKSGVTMLTPANFQQEVIESDSVVVVEFFAPWCGHCKSLTPEYKSFAKATAGIIKVAAVDADAHKELGGQYGVQGFPTIKIFGGNKNSPVDYQGARTAEAMVTAAMQEATKVAKSRVKGKQQNGESGSKKKKTKKEDSESAGAGVIELGETDFDDRVVQGEDSWIVAFTAPWCGHCKNLKGPFKQAAKKLNGKVKFANVDATVHTALAQRFGVQGYPTIKVFTGAGSSRTQGKPYNGGREESDFVAFANTLAPPPKVTELVDAKAFKPCETDLCVIAVLPDLYQARAGERTKMIAALKKTAKKHKASGLHWLWTARGLQPDVEEKIFRSTSAFPAFATFNGLKKAVVPFSKGFSEDAFDQWVSALSSGRSKAFIVSDFPTVTTVAAWDGKDAPEEDFDEPSLDDLFGDEL